jgi:hypothetical protein
VVSINLNERGSHGRDYYCWCGSGKGSDRGVWCGPLRQDGVHTGISARGVCCLGGTTAAECVRVGSLRRGLVPLQDSSGGHTRLGHITKRGDTYLRGLLTQGARSALQAALTKEPLRRTRLQSWIVQLHARVG